MRVLLIFLIIVLQFFLEQFHAGAFLIDISIGCSFNIFLREIVLASVFGRFFGFAFHPHFIWPTSTDDIQDVSGGSFSDRERIPSN